MNKNYKIKLYVQRGRFLPIKTRAHSSSGKFFSKILNFFFNFFYLIGKGVLIIPSLIGEFLRKILFYFSSRLIWNLNIDFKKTQELIPKRLKIAHESFFGRTFFVFLLVASLVWGSIGALRFAAKGLELKDQILKTAAVGQGYLNQAKEALSKQDFSTAENRFALAYQTFSRGQDQISQSGVVINQLLNLAPQKRDGDKLLQAASLVSQAGADLTSLQEVAGQLKVGPTGVTAQSGTVADAFQQIDDGVNKADQEIILAANLINQVDVNNLPGTNRTSFLDLKDKLNAGLYALDNFKQFFGLAKALSLGDKNVLLLFENNNELRASGGFMGTFGSLKIHDGSISKITVSSIYDLDGQLEQVIQPPQPLLNVNYRWFMRDSNWFLDFPLTAQKINAFYEKEGGETPDLIIALTPNLIIDWLKITGPISLPRYGVTLTPDNFIEQTQAASTLSDNLPTNSPKQILADLVPLLLQKISATDKSFYPQILQSLQDNLNSKQILAYSRDPALEQVLADFHWTGNVATSDRDYLAVASSNLGGTKTDLYIDQSESLVTTIKPNGEITNELTITRTNKLADLPETQNLSFVRVYVPEGSKLQSVTGFDYKNLDYPKDIKYQNDDDVYQWEKDSVTDNLTGTVIGKESGKTFFGNWLNLKGGQTKVVKLVYELPFNLSDVDRYSLLLQKQPGSLAQSFSWDFNFPGRSIIWKNFDPNELNTENLNSGIMLNKDAFLGIVLQKR